MAPYQCTRKRTGSLPKPKRRISIKLNIRRLRTPTPRPRIIIKLNIREPAPTLVPSIEREPALNNPGTGRQGYLSADPHSIVRDDADSDSETDGEGTVKVKKEEDAAGAADVKMEKTEDVGLRDTKQEDEYQGRYNLLNLILQREL